MITPKVVFIERFEIFSHGNDGRASSIDSERLHFVSGNPGFPYCLARSRRQRLHLVAMRLRGILRIITLSMQWIFRKSRRYQAAYAIHDGHAYAEGSEINSLH